VRFEEIVEGFLTDYRINRRKSLRNVGHYIDDLNAHFKEMRVVDITTDKIKEYIQAKIDEGRANATINRTLAALKRMFHLAKQSRKVNEIPYIPMLRESNVRKGFFEYEEYQAILKALPDYLKSIAIFAYHTGWRKAEVIGLTWDKVDLKQGTIRLDPGETKNDEARMIYMDDELKMEIKALHSKRRLGCPYVFHHDGEPIRKFEKAWKTACVNAGLGRILRDEAGNALRDRNGRLKKVPVKLFHDFRRTAARNMVRSGISERVAMKMTGHKTRNVFDRYNIVSEGDLKEAARKQQVFYEAQAGNGYNFGYSDQIPPSNLPKSLVKLVGESRFELPTSCSQGRRANQAALLPDARYEKY
jgi:integrase